MTTHYAPTDASVWKVVAKEGDTIDVGETIVILESMKMEIPVVAEVTGTITKLHVQESQAVEEDDPVADVE